MTPSARLQAIIELLTEIEATPRPADAVISAFFRARRYMGSKDRNAVAERVYRILRQHGRTVWWLDHVKAENTPRLRMLVDLVVVQKVSGTSLGNLFSGAQFAPPPLQPSEWAAANALENRTLEHPQMPEAVRLECPPWAEESLRTSLGDGFYKEMAALLSPAPLDIRVNILKASREQVKEALATEGIKSVLTPLSPWGLRIEGRPPLATLKVFQDGWFDIQDEGSQLVAVVADCKPGQQVVDFCAGAGGKTLALAATMNNKGRIIACDVLDNRLKRAAERFRRAGVHNIETRALLSERDPWVKRHKGQFDRVLVDAPCTGTGTWRRNPDARWRPLGPGLSELVKIQASILESAARLLRPGGQLIYATCSLLKDENEQQIEKFLTQNSDFAVEPVAVPGVETGSAFLRLTPARHHTDGFFAARLERKS